MSDSLERAAEAYVAPMFPRKHENIHEACNTLMLYEVRDYVAEAFEAGARWRDAEVAELRAEVERLKAGCSVELGCDGGIFHCQKQELQAELTAAKAEIERLLDLSSGIMKLTGMNGLEGQLAAERAKSQTLIALLQSLGVQAIVNGQDGHRLIAERINSAIEEYRGGK